MLFYNFYSNLFNSLVDVVLFRVRFLKGKVGIHARPGMKIVIPDGTVLENVVRHTKFRVFSFVVYNKFIVY